MSPVAGAIALSQEPAKKNCNPAKFKHPTHLECGENLEQAEDGQWFCRHCLLAGYPVKPL